MSPGARRSRCCAPQHRRGPVRWCACARPGLDLVPQGGKIPGSAEGGLSTDGEGLLSSAGSTGSARSSPTTIPWWPRPAACCGGGDAAAAQDSLLPLSIGSQGSCQIGGAVSGPMPGDQRAALWHDARSGAWLEIVSWPDGTSGTASPHLGAQEQYRPDLKQLFIGRRARSVSSPRRRFRGWFHARTARAAARSSDCPISPSRRCDASIWRAALAPGPVSAFEFLMPPAMAVAARGVARCAAPDRTAGVYVLIELARARTGRSSRPGSGFPGQAIELASRDGRSLSRRKRGAGRTWICAARGDQYHWRARPRICAATSRCGCRSCRPVAEISPCDRGRPSRVCGRLPSAISRRQRACHRHPAPGTDPAAVPAILARRRRCQRRDRDRPWRHQR